MKTNINGDPIRRLSSSEKTVVRNRDHNCCRKCGRQDSLHVHHIFAAFDGGSNDLENLSTLCASCHQEWHSYEDGTKDPEYKLWLQYPSVTGLIGALETDAFQHLTVAKFRWHLHFATKARQQRNYPPNARDGYADFAKTVDEIVDISDEA